MNSDEKLERDRIFEKYYSLYSKIDSLHLWPIYDATMPESWHLRKNPDKEKILAVHEAVSRILRERGNLEDKV
jgi:hypothetical protein